MKNKVMIYPFDIESAPLIRHNNLINEYDIVAAVSPNGWGFNGKDIGNVDSGELINLKISSDFDESLKNCDTVFFNEPSRNIDFNKFIFPHIMKAVNSLKNIICTIELEQKIINEISSICTKNNKLFKYFPNKDMDTKKPLSEKIYTIDVPVIFVVGLSERTNKFEIQLNLRENFKKMGYKVSQIGSRHYCELFDFHSFPRFMYSTLITESEKIILFNYYIKSISIKENPDIIVIGIPGGTMPFNYEFTNRFGILAYEISQAILPDVVALSLPYSNLSKDFFDLISKSYKYKFGYDIDCYNISNSYFNLQGSQLARTPQYITLDYKFIDEKKKIYTDINTPIYNILNSEDPEKMAEFIINKLQEYGKNQIV
ncbi:TIGR04066 family peptide maturation system protein [Clostridium pasteurianum]|uniref:Peptide maturation system protein, TIGR04066 family n=1 Tax=Clostridium pasteurianum BC1 TaxID=86416 RepID=R4K8V5_CLOPA|nr:TIGR04066 family peptide maturation system protein [Clostridium pasteurianum]AGK99602.1 peptide maturation system protein, TIGR04066 family [Clostridium pasteurianum BC1]